MKKYTIVSTYPEKGSQNIGDELITQTTQNAIRSIKGKEITFNVVWRAANWEEIKHGVLDCDAVIFACLALRSNMSDMEYPYLKEILKLDIPVGVIAAGTSLKMTQSKRDILKDFSNNSLVELSQLNKKSIFFTSRGLLTQSFCLANGLDNVTFSGDIAFYDDRFVDRKFVALNKINKIAISDPHYSKIFIPSLEKLIIGLKATFPNAEITLLLHGVSSSIEKFCHTNQLHFVRIYENKESGLDIYDEFDLHVGYRVHAHVSMLNRRKPSYLLEQDGRGCDYGLSIDRKISVSSFVHQKPKSGIVNSLRPFVRVRQLMESFVYLSSVDQILSLIQEDHRHGFKKFLGLDDQIKEFNRLCLEALKKLP